MNQNKNFPTIEVCCGSVADCMIAEKAGAHRVELNSALALGGLTPSVHSVRMAKSKTSLPIIAMARPRPGDFCFDDIEVETMIGEMKDLLAVGVDGFAFGIADQSGNVDIEACRHVIDEIAGHRNCQWVYHRAFDLAPNWRSEVENLIQIGFHRVLTSGQATTAIEGVELLASLNSEFGSKIEILPGSGISRDNAVQILRQTGCSQIHGSFSHPASDFVSSVANFGGQATADFSHIRSVVELLRDYVGGSAVDG